MVDVAVAVAVVVIVVVVGNSDSVVAADADAQTVSIVRRASLSRVRNACFGKHFRSSYLAINFHFPRSSANRRWPGARLLSCRFAFATSLSKQVQSAEVK